MFPICRKSSLSFLITRLRPNMTIDVVQIYAMSVGGLFALLFAFNMSVWKRSPLSWKLAFRLWKRTISFTVRHLIPPLLTHHNRYLGQWTLADVILHLIHVTANALCLGIKVHSLREAGQRAANLALVNMVLPLAGPHLSFLATSLGVSLKTYQRIHRSFGMVSLPLLIFHICASFATRIPFSLRNSEDRWGLIVSLALDARDGLVVRTTR